MRYRGARCELRVALRISSPTRDFTAFVGMAGPALASDRLIVVGSQGEALSISPYSGDVLSKLKLAAPATLAPVFAKSTMYLLNDKGDLVAYR